MDALTGRLESEEDGRQGMEAGQVVEAIDPGDRCRGCPQVLGTRRLSRSRNGRARSPLHTVDPSRCQASGSGRTSEYGADVHGTDRLGATALYFANDPGTIVKLFTAGADPDTTALACHAIGTLVYELDVSLAY